METYVRRQAKAGLDAHSCTVQSTGKAVEGVKIERHAFNALALGLVVHQRAPEAANGPAEASHRVATAHIQVQDE